MISTSRRVTKVRDLPESDGHENVSAARVSSPASTGGAGTSFEQHVATYWLAQLLVHGIPPILIDTVVTEVSFQTERLGWHTDDFLGSELINFSALTIRS
jgi:hypothetical protein